MQWGLVGLGGTGVGVHLCEGDHHMAGYDLRSWLSGVARFTSRHNLPPSMRAVPALKNQFGGNAVKQIPRSG